MIIKWRTDYTDEEKVMTLTIINKNQEINKLVDELEEQERHIKEADFEIERLNNIIKEVREYIIKEDEWIKNSNYKILKTAKLLEILDKDITKKSDYNYGKVEEDKE